MRKLSEFIGKPLFTRAGECAGTVKNALLSKNLKTVRAFEYFDDREDEHELPASSVISVQDALIVKSLAERQYKDAVPAPFGMQAYSETGESLGNVCDFLTENGEVRALLLTGGQEIEAARIASVKDALFFDLTSPLPLKQKKSAPARKRPSPEGGSPAPSQEGRPAAQPREAARPACGGNPALFSSEYGACAKIPLRSCPQSLSFRYCHVYRRMYDARCSGNLRNRKFPDKRLLASGHCIVRSRYHRVPYSTQMPG